MIERVLALVIVIAVIALATAVYRRRNGVATTTTATFPAGMLRDLGVPHRSAAIVLFTAPGCAPCEPAKRVLGAVAARHEVPLVVADVTDHHEVASAHHVYRAPTTFVVDDAGRALARISGVPRPDELEHLFPQPKDVAV